MPYSIKKAPKSKGYFVMDTTGRKYSIKPIPLARAKKQLTALHINTGHGLGDIVMPKKAFIKEHKKLLGVLSSQDPKQLKAEYEEQSKELKKVTKGKGKEDIEKYALIRKLEAQFYNFVKNLPIKEKEYSLIDALITNIKNESEQFLARPGATTEHKDIVRELLHVILPSWIPYLSAIPKGEGKHKVRGGIAVKLVKYSDGSYGISDMEGNVLEHGLTKAEATSALTKWYKFQPQPPTPVIGSEQSAFRRVVPTRTTIGSEQSAFRKVKKGGMFATMNPLHAIQSAESDARKVIQKHLDSANQARALGIGIAEGKASMKQIMDTAATELAQAGKPQAVQFLQALRAPYEQIPDYSTEDSVERNRVARAMGFVIISGSSKRGAGHTDELKAAYRELSRNANPQQHADLITIFDTALARLKSLPPAHPFLKRITGQPVNLGRDATKRLHLRQAIFDMNQVMGLGPHDDEEFVVTIPPNLNPAPPGENYNTECPICMEEVTNDRRRTPCGHVFHEQCFNKERPIDPVTGLRACPVCRKGSGNHTESDHHILVGDRQVGGLLGIGKGKSKLSNILVGGKVRFSDHKTFVQWLNAMFYELLTKPISERNNLFKARTEIRSGLPSWDESIRTFIVYDRAGKFLSLKTCPMEEYDDKRRYFMNKDNETEWGFPFIKTDYSALKRDKPLDDDGVWRSRTDGLDLYFTRIPTSLDYPLLGTPASSPSGSPKAKNSISSPKEGPGGFAPRFAPVSFVSPKEGPSGFAPISIVSASEMAGGPALVPGTAGPESKAYLRRLVTVLKMSEEDALNDPSYLAMVARGLGKLSEPKGKVQFVKKYLKGQGLPATKKNVDKICNIMDVEGVVFE